jgi:MFS family permease
VNYLAFARVNLRFLLFGFALTFFSSFGQTFFIGVFGADIRAAFGLTEGSYGSIYSLATLAAGFCVIWLGRLIDRVDLRVYSTLVCLGLVISALAMAHVGTALLLMLTICGLRLFGQGLMSHTAITSMSRYFENDRGKALSIAGLGFAAGEAVFPRAAVSLRAATDWRETWLLVAGVLAVCALPLALVLLRGHGTRHGALLVRNAESSAAAARMPPGERPRRSRTRREVVRDPRFYVVLPAIVAPAFIVTGLFFHQTTLIAEMAWTPEWFTSGFLVFAAAQLPSSLGAGPLVDRIGGIRLLPVLLVPLALGLTALVITQRPAAAMVFMALGGVTSGIIGPVVGAVWAELYGVLHLGSIRAMVTALMVFATAASPAAMGTLIDLGVTMRVLAALCVGYCVLATLLLGVLRRLPAAG